jgi:hypothetical protein
MVYFELNKQKCLNAYLCKLDVWVKERNYFSFPFNFQKIIIIKGMQIHKIFVEIIYYAFQLFARMKVYLIFFFYFLQLFQASNLNIYI